MRMCLNQCQLLFGLGGSEQRGGEAGRIKGPLTGQKAGHKLIEEAGVKIATAEIGVIEQTGIQAEIGGDAGNLELLNRAAHTVDGLLAGSGPDRELGDQRIVIERHVPARVDAAVDTNARTRGFGVMNDFSGAREKAVGGIFGVDPALDGRAAQFHIFLAKVEMLAGGDAQLPADDVDTSDPLSDGVLDLQARVHLEEVELAIARGEELQRTGAAVAD